MKLYARRSQSEITPFFYDFILMRSSTLENMLAGDNTEWNSRYSKHNQKDRKIGAENRTE